MYVTSNWTKHSATGDASPGGAVYLAPDPTPEDASIWFFTRLGGVSEEPFESLNVSVKVGDNREAVNENLSRIKAATGELSSAWIRQVSGDQVLNVKEDGSAGEGDALFTSEKDLALVVAVADCAPVALVGRNSVAMVHSGWRGSLAGISKKTVREMEDSDVRAYIGPCIRQCCYEVSEEMAEDFSKEFGPDVVDGRYLSLPGAITKNLEDAGVREVHDLGVCTGCRTDLFYSNRKEKPTTGRNLAAVARVS